MTEIKTGREAIIFAGVELYGEKFSVDSVDRELAYKKVYEVMAKNHSGKGKKGICVIGGIGVGKSAMMKVMQRLFRGSKSRFRWVSAYELKDLSEMLTIHQIKEMYGYELKSDLYIDDIGVSIDVKRYGNTVNIITELLMERYDLFVESGIKTHLSSNLPSDTLTMGTPTIKSVYGVRVYDRIKEMCEFLVFKGKSQRS